MYDSLARAEAFPADKLAYFDRERGEDLLLEMRYLPIYARPATAEYIVDNTLDAPVRPPLALQENAPLSAQTPSAPHLGGNLKLCEDLLLEMRYLPISAPPATVQYIVGANLDAPVRPPLGFKGKCAVVRPTGRQPP